MTLLPLSLRAAIRLLAQPYAQGLTTASIRFAAAAPSTTRYIRRAVPSRASTTAKPTSSSASAGPATSAPVLDDFPEDFSLPSEPEIGDYAHLAPPPRYPASSSSSSTANSAKSIGPTPSPPLTSLPGEGYTPLPSAHSTGAAETASSSPSTSGIPGEAPVAGGTDWSTSFLGLSDRPFDREVADALLKPLNPEDVEIKPDGLLYLPEIKYRRTLNAAFGPGGWGLAPRGETSVGPKIVSREWGLVCLGRLVAIARGEQEFFDPSGVATATEACKSNALMRCCKDLGIASELWDPRFIREFKSKHCAEVFVEHAVTKKKRKLWKKKGDKFEYPYKEGV